MLDGRSRKQRIDHLRRLAGLTFHHPRFPPTADNAVTYRNHAAFESFLQSIASRKITLAVRMSGVEIVDAFVIFAKCQHAQKEALFI